MLIPGLNLSLKNSFIALLAASEEVIKKQLIYIINYTTFTEMLRYVLSSEALMVFLINALVFLKTSYNNCICVTRTRRLLTDACTYLHIQ